jgi:WD40 repeat protein
VAKVWDGDTGDYRFPVTGHTGQIWNLDWSPYGRRLATAGDDGTTRVWEVSREGAMPLLTFSAQETSRGGGFIGVSFSPDGRRLMAGDVGVASVTVWDADPRGGSEWAGAVGLAKVMPDGRGMVVADDRRWVSIVDDETGRRVSWVTRPREPHWGTGDVAVSGTGDRLALLDHRGIVAGDVATGDHAFTLPWEKDDYWVADMAWSPDGSVLAVAHRREDSSRSLVVVDRTGSEVALLPEPPGWHTSSISFSPDGRLLATTRWGLDAVDPTRMPVRIWDLETGEVATRIDASAELVEFAPTGRLVATSRPVDGIAELWDVGTGERTATLTASAHVTALAFDASASRLATAHADGTVRLWDPQTGTQQLVLHVGTAVVHDVQFTPDGSKLVTGSEDGSIRVWALDVDDLVALARAELTRELSEAECRQYLHVQRCADA